jgi:hypothetical protein
MGEDPDLSFGLGVGASYGFCEPPVVGDSVFDCAIFGFGVTFLPATPTRISATVRDVATMLNSKTDLLPPFEPSSISAIAISPVPFLRTADMG